MSLLYSRNRTYMVFVNLNIAGDYPVITLTFSEKMRKLALASGEREVVVNANTDYKLSCGRGEWAIFVVE